MKRMLARIGGVVLVAMMLAGCDKCGHPVKFLAPSLPKACGDNADPGRG